MISCTPEGAERGLCLDWSDELIRIVASHTPGLMFFAITPVTADIRRTSIVADHLQEELGGSGLGYFHQEHLDAHLRARRLATYEEWIIGSAVTKLQSPTEPRWYEIALYWNSDMLLSRFHDVKWFSTYYAETDEVVSYFNHEQIADFNARDLLDRVK